MPRFSLKTVAILLVFCLSNMNICRNADAQDPATDLDRPLRVAYFVPADRQPEPDYLARLDRVMTNIQLFYRIGMQKNGLGPMAFNLDREANKQLKIIMVKGKEPMLAYGRQSQNKVRGEVREAFTQVGLDFDREVVVVFQVLLVREPGKTTEIGAFTGGGDGYKGSAVVFDDVRLDAALLSSTHPDNFSEGRKTIGEFNAYIGGIAHELGHAFGLGHDAERPVLRQRIGRSLMGRGNRNYGEELRRAGPGAFLSAASAFALSIHPLFTHRDVENTKADLKLVDLKGIPARGGLTLTGRIEGTPKPVGLIAFNDPNDADTSDYDAVGYPAPTKADGSFRLAIGDLAPGNYILRLRAYSENGKAKRFEYSYQVDRFGRPDVSQLKSAEVSESEE